MKLIKFTLGTWFVFMILAIINAGIRNEGYKPIVGDSVAHQISTVVFVIMILVVTYLLFRYFNLKLSYSDALMVGFVWLSLTVLFEFFAGYYVFGNSWDKLIAEYNIINGRIWSFVLITTFFAPYAVNGLLNKNKK